jgi:hypothetical protein
MHPFILLTRPRTTQPSAPLLRTFKMERPLKLGVHFFPGHNIQQYSIPGARFYVVVLSQNILVSLLGRISPLVTIGKYILVSSGFIF